MSDTDARTEAAAKALWRTGFIYPSSLWADLEPFIKAVHLERAATVLAAADAVEAREVETLRTALAAMENVAPACTKSDPNGYRCGFDYEGEPLPPGSFTLCPSCNARAALGAVSPTPDATTSALMAKSPSGVVHPYVDGSCEKDGCVPVSPTATGRSEMNAPKCDFVPYPGNGAYGEWRCGLRKFHVGSHRFVNYTIPRFPRFWHIRALLRAFRADRRLRRITKGAQGFGYRRVLFPATYKPTRCKCDLCSTGTTT
jgi:hypothetical protein